MTSLTCVRRSVDACGSAGIALHKLARLHEAQKDRDAAAHYHRENLERIDAQGLQGSDALDALFFLGTWHKVPLPCTLLLPLASVPPCVCHHSPSCA